MDVFQDIRLPFSLEELGQMLRELRILFGYPNLEVLRLDWAEGLLVTAPRGEHEDDHGILVPCEECGSVVACAGSGDSLPAEEVTRVSPVHPLAWGARLVEAFLRGDLLLLRRCGFCGRPVHRVRCPVCGEAWAFDPRGVPRRADPLREPASRRRVRSTSISLPLNGKEAWETLRFLAQSLELRSVSQLVDLLEEGALRPYGFDPCCGKTTVVRCACGVPVAVLPAADRPLEGRSNVGVRTSQPTLRRAGRALRRFVRGEVLLAYPACPGCGEAVYARCACGRFLARREPDLSFAGWPVAHARSTPPTWEELMATGAPSEDRP